MKLRVEFKLSDCWIGAFWRTSYNEWNQRYETDLWICLLPCVPLRFTWKAKL